METGKQVARKLNEPDTTFIASQIAAGLKEMPIPANTAEFIAKIGKSDRKKKKTLTRK